MVDQNQSGIYVPVSTGELFDKLSILEIKKAKISDSDKLANIMKEYELLLAISAGLDVQKKELAKHYDDLKSVNLSIWDAEDAIRDHERREQFHDGFLRIARSIYRLNDRRADIKRAINILTTSSIVEEKSYEKY